MRTRLRKIGNASGVIIPKPILARIGAKPGAEFDLVLDDDRIVLSPAKRNRRAGWLEAARHIAESGDDALVWPEFANTGDLELKW